MNDDTINRQAALDALADYIHNVDRVYSTGQLTHDDCMDAAHSVLDELPSAQRWISCKTALPKTEEKVWVTCEHLDIYGKPHRYVCKAFHVDRYTMRSDADWWDEGCDEYCEEDDQYYVLEGWYEYIHNWGDYSAVCITEDNVVAWCPLPEPWKGEEDE